MAFFSLVLAICNKTTTHNLVFSLSAIHFHCFQHGRQLPCYHLLRFTYKVYCLSYEWKSLFTFMWPCIV